MISPGLAILANLLRALSRISIIHNRSRIMYKTAFLLYNGQKNSSTLAPFFLFPPLFLDNLIRIMYNQNRIMYNMEKISIIHNLILVPHFK
jgi:hypothetical protein